MKLKTVLTFLYLVVSIPLFLFFKVEILVWLSFFVNLLLITGVTYYHLNLEKTFSPFLTSFVVFIYLFFIVAPIIQISSYESGTSPFPTNYPYDTVDILYANTLIFAFVLVFFIAYVYLKKRKEKSGVRKNTVFNKDYSTPMTIVIIFVVSLIIFFLNYNYIIEDIRQPIYLAKKEPISSLLIKKKVLFLVPLGGIALSFKYLMQRKKIPTNTFAIFLTLTVLILMLFFFKNPLTEKRNALGPIYITFIFLFKPSLINGNSKFFLFMFSSMVVIFPLLSTFTHIDATLKEMILEPKLIVESFIRFGGISSAFSSLHYDAYANLMATVDYVNVNGLSFGYQLLSSLLFFIPRSLWLSKPTSTGELIGDYLISDYNFNFNNLSNPIVSEGYIDFGIFGIVFMAVVLAYFIIKLLHWLQDSDPLKRIMAFYFAVHLIFLLRGDLTSGFSYYIGTFIGVYTIPKLISKFTKHFIKLK